MQHKIPPRSPSTTPAHPPHCSSLPARMTPGSCPSFSTTLEPWGSPAFAPYRPPSCSPSNCQVLHSRQEERGLTTYLNEANRMLVSGSWKIESETSTLATKFKSQACPRNKQEKSTAKSLRKRARRDPQSSILQSLICFSTSGQTLA